MQLVLAGKILKLHDLDAAIERAFMSLYAAHFAGQTYNMSDFEKDALAFFSRNADAPDLQDNFFANFSALWNIALGNGQYDQAQSVWFMPLQIAFNWEQQNQGKFIHKGTPFFWLGVTSILAGNLDAGFAWIHRSVQEDIRTSGTLRPNTPGFAVATLDYVKVDQAFRDWVMQNANLLQDFIAAYSECYKMNFSLEEFRNRFLLKLMESPSIATVFFFVYTLGAFFNLNMSPLCDYALSNDFAGQLEMNLLFDITLIIDATIKYKDLIPSHKYFRERVLFLSERAGLAIRDELDQVNERRKKDADITLSSLIDGSFTCKTGAVTGLAADIAIAYVIRNHSAHDPSPIPSVWKNFSKVRQSLFNVLFLTVQKLY